jgi:hypothetical protein
MAVIVHPVLGLDESEQQLEVSRRADTRLDTDPVTYIDDAVHMCIWKYDLLMDYIIT